MPIHKIEIVNGNINLWTSSNPADVRTLNIQLTRDAMSPETRDDALQVASRLRNLLQNLMDVRQSIDSLPRDDPDRDSNPRSPNVFWDIAAGEIVNRSVNIGVSWNGTEYIVRIDRV